MVTPPSDRPDRRSSLRIPLHRKGKLRHARTGAYVPVESVNVSPTGALLRSVCAELRVGDRVHVGLAWRGEDVLDDDAMYPAVVVRREQDDAVALRFEQPLERAPSMSVAVFHSRSA